MILALSIILIFLLLMTGKEQGMKTIGTIFFNLFFILIGIILIAKGASIIMSTILIALIFIAFTLFYQFGFHKKTVISFFSCIVTLCLIFSIVFVFVNKVEIAGLNELDLNMDVSQAVDVKIPIHMNQLAMSVIILSMLGVVMDAAMAVSSSVFELYDSNTHMKKSMMWVSTKSMGYDILGTMTNTLFFAAMGDFYLFAIFFSINHIRFSALVNSKAVYQAFLGVFLGSIACLFIIPITQSMMMFYLFCLKKDK